MRRVMVLAAAAALACGGDSKSGSGGLTGTVGGKSFSPVETVAFNAGPASCTLAGQTLPISAMGIAFSGSSGTCGLFTSGSCAVKQDSSTVLAFIANVSGTAIGAGTYQVVATPEELTLKVLPTGTAGFATAETFPATAGTCTPTSTAATGTIRITSVDASRVKGNADLTLASGGRLQGDFEASLCTAPDLCRLILGYVGSAGTPAAGASPVCGGGFTCQ